MTRRRVEGSGGEIRNPKSEGRKKSEFRIHSHPNMLADHRNKPLSDFGFRSSFGLRVSELGYRVPLGAPP
jgi:hypothetical protein